MATALQGLKILDFTTLWPGPLATLLLAELGAEVLRVEAPDRPDLLRYLPPLDSRGEGAAWSMANRNKRSLVVDLRTAGGQSVVRQLVHTHDVVVEQFRPGVLDRLGVGFEALRAAQPRLIWCAITSFGQDGPWRDRPGHDLNFLAVSGLASHMGRPGQGPAPWTALPGDVVGGTWPAVAGILAAVIQRNRTGLGQLIDISMADGALFLNALAVCQALHGGGSQRPGQGVLGGETAYDHYRTSDGRYLAVGALEPKFWAQFCLALGRPELCDAAGGDPAQVSALKGAIADEVARHDAAHWDAVFAAMPCCVDVVRTTEEALALPQFAARQVVLPSPGGPQLQSPVRLQGQERRTPQPAAEPGADTDAVLGELGLDRREIEALRHSGAVGGPP
ncbi:MAG: CoA transferase [Deltaproteobacteria bacterium]|nr:CoA transferase [Deltaproteobacteria bacterium]